MTFLNIIAAIDRNLGIGYDGKIPWRVHADLEYFRNTTWGSILIMGRKTWESISPVARKFEGRDGVVVLTGKDRESKCEDFVQFAKNLSAAIAKAWKRYEYLGRKCKVFICGGSEVYFQAMQSYLHLLDSIHLTLVPGQFLTDTYFTVPVSLFSLVERIQTQFSKVRDPSILKIQGSVVTINNLVQKIQRSYPEAPLWFTTPPDSNYANLIKQVLREGEERPDRTGVGTMSVFDTRLEFDLKDFPLLTRRTIFWKGVLEETLFFLRGKTNTKELEAKGVNIWKGNTSRAFLDSRGLQDLEEGDMGGNYGFLWRHFGAEYQHHDSDYREKGVDQIQRVLDLIQNDPTSRRMVVSAWNPAGEDRMSLPSCHILFQFYVRREKYLDLRMFQRSCDVMLGLPFNIASYALIANIFAHKTGLIPGKLSLLLGDTHIYQNHIKGANEFLKRPALPYPTLFLDFDPDKPIEDLEAKDFQLFEYSSFGPIKMEMAV